LGLSIVKHLMKAHEGRMTIDSTLGRGTTVSLHFPACREQE
jgi:two-component system phosphate regulon sensor histidine kinase PhoR